MLFEMIGILTKQSNTKSSHYTKHINKYLFLENYLFMTILPCPIILKDDIVIINYTNTNVPINDNLISFVVIFQHFIIGKYKTLFKNSNFICYPIDKSIRRL